MNQTQQKALQQALALAKVAGAAEILVLRGAMGVILNYSFDPEAQFTSDPSLYVDFEVTPPHELVIVLRFPLSDGGEEGRQSLG